MELYNKNAYIKGYETPIVDEKSDEIDLKSTQYSKSTLEYDKNIIDAADSDKYNSWKTDYQKDGKKELDTLTIPNSNVPERDGLMRTKNDEVFKYSLNMNPLNRDSSYEDPTYLMFNLKIDKLSSPLFNYSLYQTLSLSSNETNNLGSVTYFLEKYKNIPEIKSREEVYVHFIDAITKIFPNDDSFMRKQHYIEMISGLDKLNKKMVEYEKDIITLTLSEDVSLSTLYIAELYNNLTYSYQNGRKLIPENCLRFDLMIEITDVRIFKTIFEKKDGSKYSEINNNPPRIIYTLHDCNFDFSTNESLPFDQAINVSGSEGVSNKKASLKFNIKYKSISKSFKSELISGSIELHNKLYDLGLLNKKNLDDISRSNYFKNDISYSLQKINDPSTPPENTDGETDKDGELTKKELRKQKRKQKIKAIGNSAKKTAENNINQYKDKLVGKLNELRGELINDTLRHIRESLQIEEIYPSNVYSPDFRTLSLQSFAKGLVNDVANDFLNNAAGDAASFGNDTLNTDINI